MTNKKVTELDELTTPAATDWLHVVTASGTPDNDTTDEHLISAFGDLDMTGNGISDMLVMKLSRIGGNGADTYGADVRLLEFDIHYEIDSHGSGREFIK